MTTNHDNQPCVTLGSPPPLLVFILFILPLIPVCNTYILRTPHCRLRLSTTSSLLVRLIYQKRHSIPPVTRSTSLDRPRVSAMETRVDLLLSDLSLSRVSIKDGLSPGSNLSSSQPFQRLPDEVLLLVVDCLYDDLKTLTTLLVVNKFMFHAALPLIYGDPFKSWDLNYSTSPHFKKNGKMMAMILISLLKYQSRRTEEVTTTILSRVGLRLHSTTYFSELDMPSKLPTVDYSTYYTSYSPNDFRSLDFRRLFRLKRLPTLMREQIFDHEAQNEIDDNGILNIETDSQMEEIHTNEQQIDEEYRTAIQHSLINLLLYYNHDFVTKISMHTRDARAFLAKVDKMPRLSSIMLDRDDVLPEHHMHDIALGILQHNAAFPRKPALTVGFDSGWRHYHFTAPHLSVDEIMEERRRLQYPRALIYKTLGRPVMMEAGEYQNFYNQCSDIEPDRLRSFTDEYMDRYDYGEGPAREAFLRRCTDLETLRLGVGTPFDLSWAAMNALSGASKAVCGSSVHPKLRHLELTSYRPVRFAVFAVNDAATAFSESLQSLSVYSNYLSEDEFGVPIELHNSRKLVNRQLQNVSRASQIGDWVFKLPCLTSLEFSYSGEAAISVGSLDQCPNLENLFISIGRRPSQNELQHDDEEETYGSLPQQDLPELEDGPPGLHPIQTFPERDPSLKYIKKTRTLFPKWNLPRLRTLRLSDSAALRFDYESLNSMQSLKSMEFRVYDKDTVLMKYHFMIPRLCAHKSRPAAHKNRGPPLDGDSDVWTTTWHLPHLERLYMVGPPAHVFNLGWLKACPRLSQVRLKTWGSPQRIPVAAHSPLSYSIPAAPELMRRETRATMAPLLDSVLEFILLEGPWMMTRGDLVELLTVYAPHLQKLNVGVLNDRETTKGCGYRTIKAISEADAINKAYIERHVPEYLELLKTEYRSQDNADTTEQDHEQKEQRCARLSRLRELALLVPGQKLYVVKGEYRVSKWGCRDLGLESWDLGFKKQQSARRNAKGKILLGLGRAPRVYKFSGQELWHPES